MPFLNIEKIVLIFGRMALIVAIFGLNFSFKMYFHSKSIQDKKLQNVSLQSLFLCFFTKSLSKCLSATNLSPFPRIISGCGPALRHYSFCKTLHLNCLIVFWIRLCLDNYSVICTVISCYVLHQTHSELWHIQHSVFSGNDVPSAAFYQGTRFFS